MRSPDGLDGETRDPPRDEEAQGERPVLAATLAYHPEAARVGERVLAPDGRLAISRLGPDFAPVRGAGAAGPLADPYLSRSPLTVELRGDGLTLSGTAVVDGEPLEGTRRWPGSALARGLVLELGRRVVLVLHLARDERPAEPRGMIGESDTLQRVRRELGRVGPRPVAVLVRGATGTGKELAARALHDASARAGGPFVAVSLAAVAPSVVASELFGHQKGAFTGADDERQGCFRRASGGTLFLDEIGECPVEVQVALLRAIDSGKVQPVGADREHRVDVRIVSATDADLDAAVAAGRFRAPLLHRLAGYELHLPRLDERREDIGRLLVAFLSEHGAPTLSASVVARLVAYTWPGNVRQLRNVAAQLAVAAGEGPDELERVLARVLAPPAGVGPSSLPASAPAGPPAAAPATAAAPAASRRKPASVEPEELAAALWRNGWKLDRTAADLGISRPSLYRLIDADPSLRRAKDVSRDELERALGAADGDLDVVSARLEVSKPGLRRRLEEEGLTYGRPR
jgi:two-component system nitrogen regulation response regulator GlnG